MPAYVTRRAPGSPALPTRRIISYADKMLGALDLEDAELSVLLTGDARIHELNRVHRGKDRPTDVLAFALEEADGAEAGDAALPYRVLGDVVISLDTAARQAAKARHSLEQEVCLLLAHGLLHLVGYDHQTDAQEARMNREVKRLLAAANLPATLK